MAPLSGRSPFAWALVVISACSHDRSPAPPTTGPAPPAAGARSPTPAPAPLALAPADEVAPPAPPLAPPAADPAPGRTPTLLGISVDGDRALLRLEQQPRHWVDPMYRWVDIATNRVLEEWHEPALSGLPLETMRDGGGVMRTPGVTGAALEADVRGHAQALLEAGAPFEPRFAVTADTAVLNVGDWLYVADVETGRIGRRLAKDASYYPHAAPDGSFVVYARHQGLLDGIHGNYMPFVAPLPAGGPSRRLDVRDIDGWTMALSTDGQRLYVQSGRELPDGGCLVQVEIAPPSPTRSLYCVGRDERIRGLAFSPSRNRAVVVATNRDPTVRDSRAVWLELPGGKVLAELRQDGIINVASVDDAGRALAGGVPPATKMAIVDPVARRIEVKDTDRWVPFAFYGAAWLDQHRWLIGEGGGIHVVDLQALRTTVVPWPATAPIQ